MTAKKSETSLKRYDWSQAERGKYVSKANRSLTTITIERELFDAFGSEEAVNEALRMLVKIAPTERKKRSAKRAA